MATATVANGLNVQGIQDMVEMVKAQPQVAKPESTEGRPWGQPLKKPAGAPLNLG